MLVRIFESYEQMSREAARVVANLIRTKPTATLGLATGSTPLGTYSELCRLHLEEGLDFSAVTTFNLDEYLGLAADHPQSYHFYMMTNLFERVNIDLRNAHIPDGMVAGPLEAYCEEYEATIQRAGGIDLQILGVGIDGHIGFNEPASSLGSRTRVKTLTAETVSGNRRFFGPADSVPECAITMGIGTILEARRILFLASGPEKADAVARAIEGPITASTTASALQLHRDVTILLDTTAAARLQQREYYERVFAMTTRLTPSRLW